MKKLICVVMVLLLCIGIACPVYATGSAFVPSISEKDGPSIVPGTDDDGKETIGRILEDHEVIDYVYGPCLVITPVSQATTSELIPDDAEELLLSVYAQLNDGSMTIPYDKVNSALDPNNMVIRELLDISWLCEEHPVYVAPAGITIELTFDLGIGANTDIYVMSYKNNEWTPIVSTVNNGDGTVTCVFEDFCPVAFSVPLNAQDAPPQTGDTANLTLWFVLLSVSAVALVAILVLRRKFIH